MREHEEFRPITEVIPDINVPRIKLPETYVSSKPCRRGHVGLRRSVDQSCHACYLEANATAPVTKEYRIIVPLHQCETVERIIKSLGVKIL